MAFNKHNDINHTKYSNTNNGIDVIEIHQDINFITIGRIKDYIISLSFTDPNKPSDIKENISKNEVLFYKISNMFDKYLTLIPPKYMLLLPKMIIIDMLYVHLIDITGLQGISELKNELKRKNIKIKFINIKEYIEKQFIEYGIMNSDGTNNTNNNNSMNEEDDSGMNDLCSQFTGAVNHKETNDAYKLIKNESQVELIAIGRSEERESNSSGSIEMI